MNVSFAPQPPLSNSITFKRRRPLKSAIKAVTEPKFTPKLALLTENILKDNKNRQNDIKRNVIDLLFGNKGSQQQPKKVDADKLKGKALFKHVASQLQTQYAEAKKKTRDFANQVHNTTEDTPKEKMAKVFRKTLRTVKVVKAIQQTKLLNRISTDPIVPPEIIRLRQLAKNNVSLERYKTIPIKSQHILEYARNAAKSRICVECGSNMSSRIRSQRFLHRIEKWKQLVPAHKRSELMKDAQKMAKDIIKDGQYMSTNKNTQFLAELKLKTKSITEASDASIRYISSLMNSNQSIGARMDKGINAAYKSFYENHKQLHDMLSKLDKDAKSMTSGTYKPDMYVMQQQKTEFINELEAMEKNQDSIMKESEKIMRHCERLLNNSEKQTNQSKEQLENTLYFLQTINQQRRFHGRLSNKQQTNSNHTSSSNPYDTFRDSLKKNMPQKKYPNKSVNDRNQHIFASIALQNSEMDLEIDRQSQIIKETLDCINHFRNRAEDNDKQLTIHYILTILQRILSQQLKLNYATQMQQLDKNSATNQITLEEEEYEGKSITDLVLIWKRRLNNALDKNTVLQNQNKQLHTRLQVIGQRNMKLEMYKSVNNIRVSALIPKHTLPKLHQKRKLKH